MTINSLRFNTAGTATVAQTGLLTVATGGILETTGVGANAVTISGGSLTSGNGTDLIVIQNNMAAALTISSTLSGTTGLTTAGPGAVILTAANTFTGTTNVTGGTLQVGTGGVPGALAGALAIAPAGTLLYSSTGQTIANNVSGAGLWTLNGSGGSNNGNFAISGNNNSFTGTVDVNNNARYNVGAATGLPASSGNIVVASGGQLFTTAAFTGTTPVSIAGIGWTETAGNLGAIRLDGGATWAGPITLAANARIGEYSNSGGAISGNISGPYQLELWAGNGNRTITLTGSNTYASTLIDGSMNAFGGGSTAFSTGGMALNGGTLSANSYNYTFANLSGSGVVENGTGGVLPSVLTVGTDNTNTVYSGTLVNGGVGTLALVKTGNGYLALTGASTYSGGTTIVGGDLRLGNNSTGTERR